MEQNWRAGLGLLDSRNKIVNTIMDALQRHTPLSGQDGVTELWKIANRFEEKIFYSSSNQHDYLRKISLKMLQLETRTQNSPNDALPTSFIGTNSVRPSDSVGSGDSLQQVGQPGIDQADIVWSKMQTVPGLVRNRSMEQNWRAGLGVDSRNQIVNRIMDALQRHTPLSGQDGVTELWKIANRFEEKIFYASSNQHDYLRKISLKMLCLETRTQNSPNDALPTSFIGTNSVRPSDSGKDFFGLYAFHFWFEPVIWFQNVV